MPKLVYPCRFWHQFRMIDSILNIYKGTELFDIVQIFVISFSNFFLWYSSYQTDCFYARLSCLIMKKENDYLETVVSRIIMKLIGTDNCWFFLVNNKSLHKKSLNVPACLYLGCTLYCSNLDTVLLKYYLQ